MWLFEHKKYLDRCLNKRNARLCAHGGMQTWGVNDCETYSLTVNWISVCFLLVVAEIPKLDTRAIDCVLVPHQADLDEPDYMKFHVGVELEGCKNSDYVLSLRVSVYGVGQA